METKYPKTKCECGGSYYCFNSSKHFKTDKHQKFKTGNEENIYKVNCKCGGRYTITAISNHKKSKIHVDYMEKNYPNHIYMNPNDALHVEFYNKNYKTKDRSKTS